MLMRSVSALHTLPWQIARITVNLFHVRLKPATQLEEALSEFGWSWPASQANFLLCHVGKEAPQLLQQLRERGLLVRWWNQPELHDKLRITVGKPEHQSLLIQALREFITNS